MRIMICLQCMRVSGSMTPRVLLVQAEYHCTCEGSQQGLHSYVGSEQHWM